MGGCCWSTNFMSYLITQAVASRPMTTNDAEWCKTNDAAVLNQSPMMPNDARRMIAGVNLQANRHMHQVIQIYVMTWCTFKSIGNKSLDAPAWCARAAPHRPGVWFPWLSYTICPHMHRIRIKFAGAGSRELMRMGKHLMGMRLKHHLHLKHVFDGYAYTFSCVWLWTWKLTFICSSSKPLQIYTLLFWRV